MMGTLFSILVWAWWTVCFVIFFLLTALTYLPTFLFDPYNRIPNRMVAVLAWMLMKPVPGWKMRIDGADPGKADKPTIVVANHQSFLDMPLLYLLPWPVKFLAKKSMFSIPLLGWIMYMAGHISIERGKRGSFKQLDNLVAPIRKGSVGMIFPEGSRSLDGKLRRFKKGAFALAKEYNLRVLPVVLEGGHKAMPSGSWKMEPGQQFQMSVLEPLDPAAFDSAEALRDRAREMISEGLENIRKNTGNAEDEM